MKILFVLVAGVCCMSSSICLAQLKKEPVLTGKEVYEQNCLTCHQEDGMGVSGMNPPLSNTKWVLGDKTQLISIVLKGFRQPIEINDETYSTPMPAQAHLNDKQIANVLTYVRSHFGNKASSISIAEVKKIRAGK